MSGKAYANRKKEDERPLNDFYQTPKCMTIELLKNGPHFFKSSTYLDPCCGQHAIGNILRENGFSNLIEKDLIYGNDFLKDDYSDKQIDRIIMNPPFKLFDKFVEKAKDTADIVYSIGKLNFFGAHNRNINGLWNNLEYVLIFDRQIAYDRPFREDGKVECGMLVSGWFIWNKNYDGLPQIKVLDMQKYIKNGGSRHH